MSREKVVKTRYSTLSIVDLAGSERVAKSRSKGQRLQEARKINKELELEKVIQKKKRR